MLFFTPHVDFVTNSGGLRIVSCAATGPFKTISGVLPFYFKNNTTTLTHSQLTFYRLTLVDLVMTSPVMFASVIGKGNSDDVKNVLNYYYCKMMFVDQ